MNTPPFQGMSVRPYSCGGIEPKLGWPGFIGCVRWAAEHGPTRTQFIKATGIIPSAVRSQKAKTEALAKFADWVAINVWGVEDAQ